MKKAKHRLSGKRQSPSSIRKAVSKSPARKVSRLEAIMSEGDWDQLFDFLHENPQEDAALWKLAKKVIRKGGQDIKGPVDELVYLLLDQIQDKSSIRVSDCLVKAAYHDMLHTVQTLIERFSVDINHKDSVYGSALCAAVRMDATKIALWLLGRPDIDINIQNANGRSPVWFAACNQNRPVMNKLLEMGADTLEQDAEETLPEQRTTDDLATQIRNSQDLGIGELAL